MAAELKSWDTDHIPANSKMFTIWSFKENVCQSLRYKVKSYKTHFPDSLTARKLARDSVSTDQIYIHRFACGNDSQEADTCKKIKYSGEKHGGKRKSSSSSEVGQKVMASDSQHHECWVGEDGCNSNLLGTSCGVLGHFLTVFSLTPLFSTVASNPSSLSALENLWAINIHLINLSLLQQLERPLLSAVKNPDKHIQ